jgi:hypothetical protein
VSQSPGSSPRAAASRHSRRSECGIAWRMARG